MLKYVEFCAGVGGMRAGLDAAGWKCVMAVDNDPDAVSVHRLAHGSAVEADVTHLAPDDVPDAHVWVAGFPCQPFSSSGNRLGFGHNSGNVFEHITRLMGAKRPTVVILENVEGLLSNKSGHTFSVVLSKLTNLGYVVDWLLMDLRWFGPPQTRPRVFIVASLTESLKRPALACDFLPGVAEKEESAFAPLLASFGIKWSVPVAGSLSATELRVRPAVGKARPSEATPFGNFGCAWGDSFTTYRTITAPKFEPQTTLASIVAPEFADGHLIRSGRFWTTNGGTGPTKLHLRSERTSHCVGTSLGGAPLFAVPLTSVRRSDQRQAFLEHANWRREQDGMLLMRLQPDRAVLLFGPHTSSLSEGVRSWDAGDTRKYKLVGNIVAPICAKAVADLVSSQISPVRRVARRPKSVLAAAGGGTGANVP